MDRADRSGLAVAVIGHVALFAALSVSLLNAPKLLSVKSDPIEVELVEDVALVSTAPDAVAEAPAPEAAPAASEPEPMAMPDPAPPVPAPAPVARPAPKPVAQPQTRPAPTPKPVRAQPQPAAKPAAKPQPQQQRTQTAARPTDNRDRRRPDRTRPGLSRDLVNGLADTPSPKPATKPAATPGRGTATGTPAAAIGPAVTASLGAEVRRQLRPHWKSPTGADVELLRTTIAARLNPDGSLAGTPTVVQQTGINDSNRAQAKLHADQAIKAVRLAAPFNLPAQYYDAWKEIRPNFDRRLSQ
jgi:outer membrane biosynthesis protein TonB